MMSFSHREFTDLLITQKLTLCQMVDFLYNMDIFLSKPQSRSNPKDHPYMPKISSVDTLSSSISQFLLDSLTVLTNPWYIDFIECHCLNVLERYV